MNMAVEKHTLEIPVQKVAQPIGEFFIASIEANLLVDISYADIRRMELRDVERYLGIQRPLKESRVKEIREYIRSKDATFPTSIILAVNENCAVYDEKKGILTLSAYKPEFGSEEEEVPYGKIAKILDGQHRLAGFLDGEGDNRCFNFNGEFYINVSIFVGIDLPEQAKIFATVNLAQTKVNKSLVYDLEDLAKKRNPFKTCHHIAVALDKNEGSPFQKRIKRLGVRTPGRDYEPITQASFVESLVRFISENPIRDRNDILDGSRPKTSDLKKCPFSSLFWQGEKGDLIIYDIIYNYFDAVRTKWPAAWNDVKPSGNLLPKSNAFKALMRYLKDRAYPELIGNNTGKVPSVKEFLSKFEHVNLSDNDFTTRNFVSGSGGQAAFYKVLTGEKKAEELFDGSL